MNLNIETCIFLICSTYRNLYVGRDGCAQFVKQSNETYNLEIKFEKQHKQTDVSNSG